MTLWRGCLLLLWSLDYLTWADVLTSNKEETSPAGDPIQSAIPEGAVPYEDDWKRAHNFIRFGKRSSIDDDLGLDAEKRANVHSFLSFGKRPDSSSSLPDLLQYLRANREKDSWKRGHNIMRFGKRKENHNFIHFGKRMYEPNSAYDLLPSQLPSGEVWNGAEDIPEEEKRGHSMLYFGKRGGHSMLYFGKRGGHSMLYFGKRGGHALMHFGKRGHEDTDNGVDEDINSIGDERYTEFENEKRNPHNIIRFGKRFDDDSKRAHSMIHFGKRFGDSKKAHSMIHFGKRDELRDPSESSFGEIDSGDNEKRAHSMIHFGKREAIPYEAEPIVEDQVLEEMETKRAPHAMIHFGKRDDEESDINNLPLAGGDSGPYKRHHAVMHFGKRMKDQVGEPVTGLDGEIAEDKRNHAMIHFGKRFEGPSRGSHAMIHFGKRNPEDSNEIPRHVNKRSSGREWSYKDFYHKPSLNEGGNSQNKNSTQIPSNNTPLKGNTKDITFDSKETKITKTPRQKREAISLKEPVENAFPISGYELVVKMQPKHSFSGKYITADELEDKEGDSFDRPDVYSLGTDHDFQFLPSRQIRSDFLTEFTNYRRPYKKENAKNVFLHFGKR